MITKELRLIAIAGAVVLALAGATLAAQPPVQQPPQQTTPPQTAQPPCAQQPQPQPVAQIPSDAPILLDRIATIVNEALQKTSSTKEALKSDPQPVGTTGALAVTGAASARVSIDRDKLDEIRAEIEQLKVMLKR